jgi:activator of 2-hydroxyglutaryl-CoA dehydratase
VKKMRYVGVDVGKWRCRAAIMNPDGVVVDEFTFPNDAEGILDLASRRAGLMLISGLHREGSSRGMRRL